MFMADKSAQPNILLPLHGDPAELSHAEQERLRHLGQSEVLVRLQWAELEPEQGLYDEYAFARLREGLIRLESFGLNPVLCLFSGEGPAWFTRVGGWYEEDNLRCYLRFVGKVVRSVGHLVNRYITFYEPNAAAFRDHAVTKGGRRFSHMACTHIRAYKLIHDMRSDRHWNDTEVGFVFRVIPPNPLRRGIFSPVQLPLSIYQELPLKAMARGEFLLPLRNVLRVQPGQWCDFMGMTLPKGTPFSAIVKSSLQAGLVAKAPVWLVENL